MPKMAKDMTGEKYGRLTVIERSGYKGRHITWKCRCDCGSETIAIGQNLKNANTLSCGCLNAELVKTRGITHGMRDSQEYNSWRALIERCTNSAHPTYRNYGARGITVCSRWRESFSAFYSDMGPRPSPKHSIDRINNALGYEKTNCRWATKLEQCNNMRTNTLITAFGKTQTIRQWATELGMVKDTIRGRLRLGWKTEAALTTPVGDHFGPMPKSGARHTRPPRTVS